jgi:putative spermidine/putrescine transport system substrate-binding protein
MKIKFGAALTALMLGSILNMGVAAAEDVVFAGAGGSIAKAYREKIFPEFEKKTGIKVNYVAGTILEGLVKVEAQRNNPNIDVVSLTDEAYAQFRQKGLFEKLSPAVISRFDKVFPALKYAEDYGVPMFILTTGIAYNKKIFAEKGWPAPTSLTDFWDPKFKGHIVVWTPSTTTGVLMLLLAAKTYGGDEQNVDPAFKKIAEIKNDISFNRADEMTMLFQQGQAWIGWWNNIRVQQVRAAGLPIELVGPKEGTPVYTNGIALVKGAPHRENGVKLMNWILSDEGQTLIARYIGGGPVVPEVKLDAKLAQEVPYGPAVTSGIFVADMNSAVKNRAAWLERWAKEVER